MDAMPSRQPRITSIVRSLRGIFLLFMIVPLTGILRYFVYSYSISGRTSLRAKVIACTIAGYVIYYFIAERKKWGLNFRLVVIVIIYFLTWVLGAFIKNPGIHLALNIFNIILFSFAYIYVGTKENLDHLNGIDRVEFEQIHWAKKAAGNNAHILDRMAVWTLASIPFLGIGLLYMSEVRSRLINGLGPLLVILSIFSVLVVNKLSIANFIRSARSWPGRKKKHSPK